MKILVLHANNANRGDEAAVHAMIDEILALNDSIKLSISINGSTVYPNLPIEVEVLARFPKLRSKIAFVEFFICVQTNGLLCFSQEAKWFMKKFVEADLIIHAPGGPSIGDIYQRTELLSLIRLDMARRLGKKYMFYAPSMGPFKNEKRNKMRRRVLQGATAVVVRDPISQKYVQELVPNMKVDLAFDSAIQHDIDLESNQKKLENYTELNVFLQKHDKCIGITITDLLWHPNYREKQEVQENIHQTFTQFIKYLSDKSVGVVFIPQLYGTGNDADLMRKYALKADDFFTVDDNDERFDAYFQQFLISKLYAVVGMRYHSNIFSAKMGIPFISVSYEQKMIGFMNKMGLDEYCIPINELTFERLMDKFEYLLSNYKQFQDKLEAVHKEMVKESYKTTVIVKKILGV